MKVFSFLSCLTDHGANIKGSAQGPIYIKDELLKNNHQNFFEFHDFNSEKSKPQENIKEIVETCSYQHFHSLNSNQFPVLLGGDHSCAMASISSSSNFCEKQNQPLYVFWFDAHADIHTTKTSETGNIHGMPVAMLANLDDSGLILNPKKYIDLSKFFLFGARSIDHAEKKILKDNGIVFCNDDFLQSKSVIQDIVKSCPDNSFFHVSFDVDCLCPQEAPGVSTPEEGGFTINESLELLKIIFEDSRFKALDVVEYNPLNDSKDYQTLTHINKIFDLLFISKNK